MTTLLLLSLVFAQAPATIQAPSPSSLSQAWDAERRDYGPTPLLDHAALQPWLDATVKQSGGSITIEEIGRSLEGRSIAHLTVGRGPFHVLLWSQMHGDEPTATAALLDVLEYVRGRSGDPSVRRMLDALTVHVVPMLNPDGAARFGRRNAQGIDINRDALLLQTPEGRALKALRDALQPALGFNLHDQSWRTSAGGTGKPASISMLAVALDEPRTDTPGRTLAKKTCAVIRDALEPLVPGQIARYDDTFEVRAFGDNITKWGTPVVLIETGPHAGERADEDLAQLNFVAILTALESLATGRVQQADAARYDTLPENEAGLFTLLVRNATIVTGTGVAPFTGDVGLNSARVVREVRPGTRQLIRALRVDDLGDLRVSAGLETVDGTGLAIRPSQGWTEGADVQVADWKKLAASRPLAVGAAVDLALLRASGSGAYRVVRIIPAERVLDSVEAGEPVK
jgi:hypothetical protein